MFQFLLEDFSLLALAVDGATSGGISGQRVSWRHKQGIITGYEIKTYSYPIGYNILCDDGTKVFNSSLGEIAGIG